MSNDKAVPNANSLSYVLGKGDTMKPWTYDEIKLGSTRQDEEIKKAVIAINSYDALTSMLQDLRIRKSYCDQVHRSKRK